MKKIITHILVMYAFIAFAFSAYSQNQLVIPPLVYGPVFNLNVQSDSTEFFPGHKTPTYGVNGPLLGPTLVLNRDEMVTLNVTNNLNQVTTMHWHGLHVPPMDDGGPHQVIAPGATWSPMFKVMNDAATFWYHPHGEHKTDLQVSKGVAGMIIVRDSLESSLSLPRNYGVDDFPLILQTKCFDVLYQVAIATPFDTVPMVNGTIDPFMEAPAQVVRLRLLNGASERSFMIGFSNNMTFHQIATDGGLRQTPLSMTRLLIAPGERAELLVDLSALQGQTVSMMNFGTQIPSGVIGAETVGGGMAQITDYDLNPLNGADYPMLQINVITPTANPVTTIPSTLVPHTPWNVLDADVTRTFTFAPETATAQAMVMGPFTINGTQFSMQVVNDTVYLDNIEIWTLVNQTMVAHPFHIHDVQFYVTDVNGGTVPAHMQGKKDVVLVDAQSTVSFITKFEDFADDMTPYMYHCHLLHHEDDGMMGSFLVLDTVSTSVDEFGKLKANIFPNPANSNTLRVQPGTIGEYRYLINDITGKEVMSSAAKRAGEFDIDISDLEPGSYIIHLISNSKKISSKFIRQ